jgi:enolase
MATVTHVTTLGQVAKMLGEDQDLLEAIVYNDDNMTYGNIVSVYTGTDEAITALTDDGISEIKDMLAAARRSTKDWHDFLKAFVSDPDVITRVKDQPLR